MQHIAKQNKITGRKVLTLIICLAIPLAVGFLSSMLAGDIRGSYEQMTKAPLSPPGWLFGIVWPVLYVLMGLASYLVVSADIAKRNKQTALGVYGIQLVLNFAWSIIFFRADNLWLAFAIIVALDILVAVTLVLFSRVKKMAGWLLIPYMVWILFASYLNISFAILN